MRYKGERPLLIRMVISLLSEIFTYLRMSPLTRLRMHDPTPDQGAYLRSVAAGHMRYYGVPMNGPSVSVFRKEVCQLWMKVLRRRSHKHNLLWPRMKRLIARWIPFTRICHPYLVVRLGVTN